MEQLILLVKKATKKHPIKSVVIVVALAVLLFFAAVEAGKSIGDAIWR